MGRELLEKDIEKILVDEIKSAGGRAYKFTSPGNAGVPDRIVFLPGGVMAFVELKTDKGQLTQLQDRQIRRLRQFGQRVYVAKGVSGVAGFLEEMGLNDQAEKVRKRHAV